MSVLIVTSVGDVVVDLHADRCPLTAKNFLKLCKMKYYNGCLFHKVEKDFMAQTGDPTGTGAGGDSVYKFLYGEQARFFKDEIHPDLKHSKMGTVAMASAGEDCNASQFYFTLRDDIDYLDEKHTVFGLVEEKEGLDTLAKINESLVDDKGRPFKDIRIKHTYILDDPFEDPPQLSEYIPDKSPEGKPHDETAEERLEDTWVPMDEKLAPEELEELIRAKDAHTNAAILESIGDIPDAEIKPPENVLFVCKLNPVTQDEDLFTIFSRFGTVTSADIIRDYKTGDSLCYAFIEFETNEACERAFFKMDNVLIDDRRIHVDFSQSVSKLWNQYRHGKGSQDRKGGCFKCGNTDHIARDCQQGSNNKQQGPKYVLKNDQTQHGGDGRKRYDMVFDEDLEDKNIRYDDKNRADERADDRAHRDHRRSLESSHRPKDERDYRRSESDRYRREDYHERKRRDRDDACANRERKRRRPR
ncbi:peptidyl-prolyl cis-trans isomerase CYP59 [Asparagus officinalis]|uniref:peptidyl-prolyl cis-trans isomerase CYP59 n=1 Tax=Asparagus officinalis TaxID=4686 RepID=UPI00098E2FE2|nr:peptidyl-prolyl cis-trans isomerase CYP59 [Asparagus officinalis]